MVNKMEIKWDDDDGAFEAAIKGTSQGSDGNEEFLQMLEETKGAELAIFRVGDKVTGTISAISDHSDDVTVEIGSKTSAIISKQELMEPDPERVYRPGEIIEAFLVSKSGGEFVLGRSMSHRVAKDQALESAYSSRLPVKGKVVKENKGGFEVQLMGKTAFCPVSQMDLKFIKEDEKARYLGKEFDFIIDQMSGRNLVVSRSALLRQSQAEQLERLKERLSEGLILDGVVTELRDFGAIIDFSGLSGMVHISEVSHSRLAKVSDALQVGQQVKVKVLSIDEQKGQPRIGLSIKQAGEDPWNTAAEKLAVGQNYVGRVTKLEAFGAFVEIAPGLEGLVHVSEMAWTKRVHHPRDVVSVGDMVETRLLAVDPGTRRISLSLKALGDDPWLRVERELQPGKLVKAKVASLKAFGAIMDLDHGMTGLLPTAVLKAAFGEAFRKHATPPKELEVSVSKVDRDERKILLTLPNLSAGDEAENDYRDYLAGERARTATAGVTQEKSMGSFGELLTRSMGKG